jgi:hypothetical protein
MIEKYRKHISIYLFYQIIFFTSRVGTAFAIRAANDFSHYPIYRLFPGQENRPSSQTGCKEQTANDNQLNMQQGDHHEKSSDLR